MVSHRSPSDAGTSPDPARPGRPVGLGPALGRAWVGYQLRLDGAMDELGFGERALSDGRVLRCCAAPTGSTISGIGRQLGITRQGAGKVVARLSDRGYVSVVGSPSSGREKSVTLTPRGVEYLEARRRAARAIEEDLRAQLGEEGFDQLAGLLGALAGDGEVRMRTYLLGSGPAAS